MAEARALKDKEDVTKEEIEKELERFQKEFAELYQKYNAQNNATNANPEDMLDADAPAADGQVIDADEKPAE